MQNCPTPCLPREKVIVLIKWVVLQSLALVVMDAIRKYCPPGQSQLSMTERPHTFTKPGYLSGVWFTDSAEVGFSFTQNV